MYFQDGHKQVILILENTDLVCMLTPNVFLQLTGQDCSKLTTLVLAFVCFICKQGRTGFVTSVPSSLNSLRPSDAYMRRWTGPSLVQITRQNDRHFADDTFKYIFLNENVIIWAKMSLKFIPKGPINNIAALVQIMAWRQPGDKPLSESMMVRLPAHICVTRPQWVNWTIRNKLQWNFNGNSNIFIQENALENVVCEMASILSRPQCVNPFHATLTKTYIYILCHSSILTWVVEMPLDVKQWPTYSTSWSLMTWQRKEPGHQQPWYLLHWTELILVPAH